MKKTLVILSLVFAFSACKKEQVNQEAPNATFEEVLKMGHANSRDWFISQTPEIQSEIWKYKIKNVLQFKWSEAQTEALLQFSYEIDASWFQKNIEFKNIEERWITLFKHQFTKQQIFNIIGTLESFVISETYSSFKTNGPDLPSSGQFPMGPCECNGKSDYCDFPFSIVDTSCKLTKTCHPTQQHGCGFMLGYPCEGICGR